MSLLSRYRASGADLPFGDPLRAHPGVAMEGYFWRFTDPVSGRVVIALCGVSAGPRGSWATVGLAGHPGGTLALAEIEGASADPVGVGARAGSAFAGDDTHVRVDLGPRARLDVVLAGLWRWPHRALGGSSVFQAVPGLNQYWHPWALGGRAFGTATLGGETFELRGADVYAEKNWGREGFPDAWWWGQAQGFPDGRACVAFAGGRVSAGPLATEVTALVVGLPDATVVRLGDPVVSPVRAEVGDESWRLRGRSRDWEIQVEAHAPLGAAHVLPVPLPSEHRNTAGAIEHLAGAMDVEVRRRGRLVWRGESRLAGLEHGGLARARAELARRGVAPEEAGASPPAGPV